MEYLLKCKEQGGGSSTRDFYYFLSNFQKASRWCFFLLCILSSEYLYNYVLISCYYHKNLPPPPTHKVYLSICCRIRNETFFQLTFHADVFLLVKGQLEFLISPFKLNYYYEWMACIHLFEFILKVYEYRFQMMLMIFNCRNFAKRQMTWFRNEQIYHWLDASKPLVCNFCLLGLTITIKWGCSSPIFKLILFLIKGIKLHTNMNTCLYAWTPDKNVRAYCRSECVLTTFMLRTYFHVEPYNHYKCWLLCQFSIAWSLHFSRKM